MSVDVAAVRRWAAERIPNPLPEEPLLPQSPNGALGEPNATDTWLAQGGYSDTDIEDIRRALAGHGGTGVHGRFRQCWVGGHAFHTDRLLEALSGTPWERYAAGRDFRFEPVLQSCAEYSRMLGFGEPTLAEGWVNHPSWGYVRHWWTQEWEDWSRLPGHGGYKPGGGIAPGSGWDPLEDDGPSEEVWFWRVEDAGLTPPGEDTGNGNGGNSDDSSEDDETDEPDPEEPPTGDLAEVLKRLAAIEERQKSAAQSLEFWFFGVMQALDRCAGMLLLVVNGRHYSEMGPGFRSLPESVDRIAGLVDASPIGNWRFSAISNRRALAARWSDLKGNLLRTVIAYAAIGYRRVVYLVKPDENERREVGL